VSNVVLSKQDGAANQEQNYETYCSKVSLGEGRAQKGKAYKGYCSTLHISFSLRINSRGVECYQISAKEN
jgi:hypothetical protein